MVSVFLSLITRSDWQKRENETIITYDLVCLYLFTATTLILLSVFIAICLCLTCTDGQTYSKDHDLWMTPQLSMEEKDHYDIHRYTRTAVTLSYIGEDYQN